jgi:hypothetical protein
MSPAKKKSSMSLGKQHVSKRSVPWEAQELSDINRYWQRPYGSREYKRQMSVKRVAKRSSKR